MNLRLGPLQVYCAVRLQVFGASRTVSFGQEMAYNIENGTDREQNGEKWLFCVANPPFGGGFVERNV